VRKLVVLGFLLVTSGCHHKPPVTYYDFAAYTDVPSGVDAGLITRDRNPCVVWGAFSGSSIAISFEYPIFDSVLIDWTEDGKKEYSQVLVVRQFFPPIDPVRQKYFAQFWFHPGGKVNVKVDTVPIGECGYTEKFDKSSIPQYGPCSVTGKW